MIFVWLAGIELDLKQAWAERRETGVTAGLALVMPLLFGCAAAADQYRDEAADDPDPADDPAALSAGAADPAACSCRRAGTPAASASRIQGAQVQDQGRTRLGIAHSGKLSGPRPA
jgi:hypothetical protein